MNSSIEKQNQHLQEEIKRLRQQKEKLEAQVNNLLESEARFRTLFQTSNDAIFLMSGDQFLDCNQATKRIFGCTRGDIVGSNPYIFSPPAQPDGRNSKEKAIEKILAATTSENQFFEWVHTRLDGTPFFADVRLNSIHLNSKARILAVVHDATERKRAEQEIQTYMEELGTVHAIAMAGANAKTLEGLIQRTSQILNEKIYTDSLTIGLVDEEAQLVRFFTPDQPDLEYPYRPSITLNSGIAGEVIRTGKLIKLPDVTKDIRYIGGNPNIHSELCVPLITKRGKTIGVINAESNQPDAFTKSDERFLTTVARHLTIEIEQEHLLSNLQHTNRELRQAYDVTLFGWAKALEIRDKETAGHSQRVTALALKLARAIQIDHEELIHIYRGSILHDIGKMGIPDQILNKPGPLTNKEWEIMRTHPTIANDLLKNIPFMKLASVIPYLHHEKWDGSGYPLGLKGEEIPIAARIFAVVDVWDSLLSDRPYRAAWTIEEVRKYISTQSGVYFDPKIVEIFLRIV